MAKKTQDNFRFTAKFPKVITHDKCLKNVDKELELFKTINSSYDKTLALLIQLSPPEIVDGLQPLRELVRILDNRFRYAVQVKTPILVPRLCTISLLITIYVWGGIKLLV